MTIGWREQLRPGVALRGIVREATSALIAMDADRLEELARCCADLNRELQATGDLRETAAALTESASEVKLLGMVLLETRANLTVLSRLRAIRLRQADAQIQILNQNPPNRPWPSGGWPIAERSSDYGDN